MILFGLKTCDTCRKASKEIEAAGIGVTFRDVRADPLDDAMLNRFLAAFGGDLINTRSTTWRSLTDDQRNRPPVDLLRDHPALMKRPVIVDGDTLTIGWNAETRKRVLGET